MEKDLISEILDGRVEKISCLDDNEKEELNKKKEVISIEDYVKDLTPNQQKMVKEYLDDAMTEVYNEAAKLNEKYYKYGFSDGMNIAIASFKLRPEVEGRFSSDQS